MVRLEGWQGRRAAAVVLVLAMLIAAQWPPRAATAAGTTIMGPSALTASELAGWYASTGMEPHPDLGIDIRTLAGYFITEGRAEGVRGDVAFAQSIVETGYFTFPRTGQVRPSDNNYGGIGAVDGGTTPERFPSPQIGVRAQIQHLRAYGDPTVTEDNLANPLVDPRFDLVTKGSAIHWDDLGSGLWASDPDYGTKVLAMYARIRAWADFTRTAIPLTGDWNGDGRSTPGWYKDGRVLLRDSNSGGGSDVAFNYGRAGDLPVVGDWDGNGTDTIGVRRGAVWYLRNRHAGGAADVAFTYGRADDVPVTGDWNGNGTTTAGVRRGSEWHLRNRHAGGAADLSFFYGIASDLPVTGDWDRNRTDTVGVVRGSTWYLRNSNTGGSATIVFDYRG